MKYFLITLLASFFAMNLYAESETNEHYKHYKHEQHRHHDAHVHGVAELTLAQEGHLIEINFESPASNIVGFEHQASTEQQKLAIEEAKSKLESAQQLFTFDGTNCKLKKAEINVSELAAYDDEHEKHHKNKADNHVHKEHEHKANKETHSEITAQYQFTCSNGAKLKAVSVHLLKQFPRIEKLNTQWITDTKQGANELGHENNMIRLR